MKINCFNSARTKAKRPAGQHRIVKTKITETPIATTHFEEETRKEIVFALQSIELNCI